MCVYIHICAHKKYTCPELSTPLTNHYLKASSMSFSVVFFDLILHFGGTPIPQPKEGSPKFSNPPRIQLPLPFGGVGAMDPQVQP